MTPEQTLLIMKWQLSASILMGLDYFIPNALRKKANAYVKSYFRGMQQRVDHEVSNALIQFKGEFLRILFSIVQIVLGVGLFIYSHKVDGDSPYLFISMLCLGIALIIAGLNFAFRSVFEFFTKLGIAAPFRIITTILVGSPKGPIAAIGFLCLIVSFYLRYDYISV